MGPPAGFQRSPPGGLSPSKFGTIQGFTPMPSPSPTPPNADLLRRLAETVAGGMSLRGAARHVGVSERQSRRWQKLPIYQKYLTQLRQDVFNQVVDRMASVVLLAEGKLVKVLESDDVPPGLVVKALGEAAAALSSLHSRFGPAGEGPQGAGGGGITVPGLDARFEAKPKPEAEGGVDG
jgi:hypothetical protein